MLCDQADKVAEKGFPGPLRQLMFLGQGGREMLEGILWMRKGSGQRLSVVIGLDCVM
jgi:hypothetical protein